MAGALHVAPIRFLHGTAELSQSQTLAAALKKHGIEHHWEIIEGAPHAFHLQPKQKDLRPLVVGFFDKHLSRK